MVKIVLDKETSERVAAVIEADTDNFVFLANMLGLDPATDFRHSDLTGVDLSNCDLRGYDFSGADLTGAYGTDVIWDETTVLTDAKIAGTFFEVPQ
jgi:uncharacterized protein YjbI with pentapeptide repeats